MTGTLLFDPLLPWLVIWALAALAALFLALQVWRNLAGWPFRALAALALLLALANPSLQDEADRYCAHGDRPKRLAAHFRPARPDRGGGRGGAARG